MKHILMVTYGGGHVKMLIPVIHTLMNEPDIQLTVLGLTTAGALLKEHNIPYISFKDILTDSDSRAREWGELLAGPENAHSQVPHEESVAYMGLCYVDLLERLGEEEATQLYRERGRQAFYPITVLDRLIGRLKPDLVVATNSPRAERASIDVARQHQIPAVCLVDLFAIQEAQWIGQAGYADKICVLSDYVKNFFISAGRKSEELVVTGNPAFDSMKGVKCSAKREEIRQRKGWTDDTKVILWASSAEPAIHPFSEQVGDPELPLKVETALRQLVRKEDNCRLVIRPHPNENTRPEGVSGLIDISGSEENLTELLLAVDVVVVLASTVGLQAALMSRPVVNIKASLFSSDAPYDEMGISVAAQNESDVGDAVLRALSQGQTYEGLPEIGTATNRVATVLKEMTVRPADKLFERDL